MYARNYVGKQCRYVDVCALVHADAAVSFCVGVLVCGSVCVCIFIYVYTCIYVYTYVCTRIHISIHMYVHVFDLVRTDAPKCICL